MSAGNRLTIMQTKRTQLKPGHKPLNDGTKGQCIGGRSVIAPSLVPTLLKLREIGTSYQKIAAAIGASYTSVHRAINGSNHKVKP